MKKQIIESNTEPNKNCLWLTPNGLKRYGKSGWEDLTNGSGGGEGGSNKSVKFFAEHQEGDLTTFKVNDKEIPFTKGNEDGIGEICLINEQDFNYIENNIKGCGELQIESLSGGVRNNGIIGINVLYMLVEGGVKYYTIIGPSLQDGFGTMFILYKNENKCYFRTLT